MPSLLTRLMVPQCMPDSLFETDSLPETQHRDPAHTRENPRFRPSPQVLGPRTAGEEFSALGGTQHGISLFLRLTEAVPESTKSEHRFNQTTRSFASSDEPILPRLSRLLKINFGSQRPFISSANSQFPHRSPQSGSTRVPTTSRCSSLSEAQR